MTDVAARLPAGEVVLFEYRVDALLGTHDAVEVYRASVPATGEVVVVKVPSVLAGPEALRAMTQEGAFLRQVRHPNVVAFVQGGFLDDGTPAYAREFVDGPTLAELVAARGAFPFWEALLIVLQLLDGLAGLHSASLLHPGISPTSIRVETLTGIAKFVSFGDAPRRYAAPERAAGRPADARADLHALGLLLYELLTGAPYLDAAGRVVRDDLHASMVPALPLPAGRPPMPAELARLVADLLEADPSARPADVATVVAAIEDVLHSCAPKAAPDAPATIRGSNFPPVFDPEAAEDPEIEVDVDLDGGW